MGKNIITAGVLAVALAGGAVWFLERPPAHAADSTPAPEAVPVVVDKVRREDVPIFTTGLGTVQAFNTVTVRVRVDGQLDKVNFTEGQDVKAGDVLAQIDPRPFQAALGQAEAQKAKDEAQLANAKLDLQRFSNLAQRQFATKQSVDTQTALVHQLEAAVQGDQSTIDNAKVQLGYTTITAPIAGRTGMRLVDQGNIVHATDAGGLVVITQLHPISTIFTLPEKDLPRIAQAGKAGTLTVEAWSEDDSAKLDTGTLTLIDNQIDQSTGTVRLKASFPNKEGTLWPGQFVNAHLLLALRHDGLTVPAQTVQRGPDGLYAWIVKPDQTVAMRPVSVGQTANGVALIDKGLDAGDTVVVDGQYKLQTNVKVATTPFKAETAQLQGSAQ
jgi:multidrug efflux system membrane fusion protein